MKLVYPTLIKQDGDMFLVFVPDLDINTEGQSFGDAISMARDAIGIRCTGATESENYTPEASTAEEAIKKAKEDADEIFDYSDGIMTFVDVDTNSYRNTVLNKSVKKNCTIPGCLNDKAERAGVNFSKVLQEALIGIVGNR